MSDTSPNQWFKMEERFFSEVDQKLVENLRAKMEVTERADAIKRVTGIKDDALASAIASKKISVETLSAFRLVPLVAVAWADERLDDNERTAVLQAAKKSGIEESEPAGKLLAGWLQNRPSNELFETWVEYARSLSGSLTGDLKAQLQREVSQQVREVAEAAGGFLGVASISSNEKALIQRIEQALS